MHERELGAEIEKVFEDINNSIDQYMADNLVETWKQEFLPFDQVEYNECLRNTENVVALIIRLFTNRFDDFNYTGDIKITHLEEIPPIEDETKEIEESSVEEPNEEQ